MGEWLTSRVCRVDMFHSNLFRTNSWQHRLPEWAVSGPAYTVAGTSGGTSGQRDLGMLGAGYWGLQWEYRGDASYCSQSHDDKVGP